MHSNNQQNGMSMGGQMPPMMGGGRQQSVMPEQAPDTTGMTEQQVSQGKSLWIGDVEPWMNENDIAAQFNKIAQVTNVKLIKDKQSGKPVGYGFVEFPDYETARDVFQTLNGQRIPGQQNRCFKLNWASHGGGVARSNNQGGPPHSQGGFNRNAMPPQQQPHHQSGFSAGNQGPPQMQNGGGGGGQQEGYQVYVGDLDPGVTNQMLLHTFKQIYKSVFEAKVIVDPVSRVSKGYGFIKFETKEESERALQEMNGRQLLGRNIKMNYASQRNRNNAEAPPAPMNNRYGNQNNHQGGGMGGHPSHQGGYQNPQQPQNLFSGQPPMGRGGMDHGSGRPPFNGGMNSDFPGGPQGGMNSYGNPQMGGRGLPGDPRGGYNNPSMMIPQMPNQNSMGLGGPGQYGQNPNQMNGNGGLYNQGPGGIGGMGGAPNHNLIPPHGDQFGGRPPYNNMNPGPPPQNGMQMGNMPPNGRGQPPNDQFQGQFNNNGNQQSYSPLGGHQNQNAMGSTGGGLQQQNQFNPNMPNQDASPADLKGMMNKPQNSTDGIAPGGYGQMNAQKMQPGQNMPNQQPNYNQNRNFQYNQNNNQDPSNQFPQNNNYQQPGYVDQMQKNPEQVNVQNVGQEQSPDMQQKTVNQDQDTSNRSNLDYNRSVQQPNDKNNLGEQQLPQSYQNSFNNTFTNNQPNQMIKSKLPIEPISQQDIHNMNQQYLKPLIDNSDVLFIL